MSSYTKAKLKEAREAIGSKRWTDAQDAALAVLESEPDNYNANVFLGLALLNLEQFDRAEAAYRKAIAAQPTQSLAYQGLDKFFTQRKAWDKLVEVLTQLADLYLGAEDATKCGECIQRIILIQREEGAKSQRAAALSLVLPGSKYYDLLASLPAPKPTAPLSTTTFDIQMFIHLESLKVLKEVIDLTEYIEKDLVDKEVERKRMRIDGAGKSRETLRNEAGVEVWTSSRLPELYEQVLSHSDASDEDRRSSEGKLLRHLNKLLVALPGDGSPSESSSKADVRTKILEMARGMVIVAVPDELAWSIHLEWQDIARLTALPRHLLRQHIDLFPRSPRSLSFQALLLALRDEQYLNELAETKKLHDVDRSIEGEEDDPLSLALKALELSSTSSTEAGSCLVERIAAQLYLIAQDNTSAVETVSNAQIRLSSLEKDAGLTLSATKAALDSILGVALSHIHGSQNHTKSMRLLDAVLDKQPDDVDALFARGQIEAQAERWEAARGYYLRISQRRVGDGEAEKDDRLLSLHRDPKTESRAELAWCDVKLGRLEEGKSELEETIETLDADAQLEESMRHFSEVDRAKAWWRSAECVVQLAVQGQADFEEAFNRYITSINRCPSFAPAFTSLGTFYEQHRSPADPIRSSKCFQKAFELDPTQFHAAFKLADHYAEEREWDLVAMIARRVVEGEGGAQALEGQAGAIQRHKSQNAWAWKAIGSVRLQHGQPEEAISPLHISLRANDEDATAWQRLGEAYFATGRYAAALKTFHRALELDMDSWQTKCSIAEVRRELGEYEEAILIFEEILQHRPDESSIRVANGETHLVKARKEFSMGYVARAADSFQEALRQALHVNQTDAELRSPWKIVSDACHELSNFGGLPSPADLFEEVISPLLDCLQAADVDGNLPAITAITRTTVEEALATFDTTNDHALPLIALSTYVAKHRVALAAHDDGLVGSAWADLATGLSALSKRSPTPDLATQAISCIKEALNHEPANGLFWTVLGNLTFTTGVKVAQHAYIRAIESSLRDPVPWSNLGFLYLHHGDLELAAQAFVQAQTLDPDHASPWIGQALIAAQRDQLSQALSLFSQAVELCEGSSLEADFGLAKTVFTSLSSSTTASDTDLHSSSFALSAYLSHRPEDATVLHLAALFAERLGQFSLATERIEKASGLLETEYERTEDAAVALRFAIAQSSLGRIRLANGDYSGAQDACRVSLDLLDGAVDEGEDEDEDSPSKVSKSTTLRAKMNALVTLALAQHLSDDTTSALSTLASASEEVAGCNDATLSGVQSHLSTLQAQLQWSLGEHDDAKSQLLEALSHNAKDLRSVISLLAVAIVSEDAELLEAGVGEVEQWTSEELQMADPRGDLDRLKAFNRFWKGNDEGGIAGLQQSQGAVQREKFIEARLRQAIATEDAEKLDGIVEAAGKMLRHDQSSDFLRSLAVAGLVRKTGDGEEADSSELARLSVLLDPSDVGSWKILKMS